MVSVLSYSTAPATQTQEKRQKAAAQKRAWLERRRRDPEFVAREKAKQQERYERFKADPEKVAKNAERSKQWYRENKERAKELQKRWHERNPGRANELGKAYIRRRYSEDPSFAIACRVRARVYEAIKNRGASKTGSTEELVGCSFDYLRQHIERQFKGSMSWDNPSSFHIDHIVPLASFDLTDPAQLKVACNWQNLRPIPPKKNMSKGAKLTEPQMPLPISFSINT